MVGGCLAVLPPEIVTINTDPPEVVTIYTDPEIERSDWTLEPNLRTNTDRLVTIETNQKLIIDAVNQLGQNLDWLCQNTKLAFEGFAQMRQEIASAGPVGLIKGMLKGGKNGGE